MNLAFDYPGFFWLLPVVVLVVAIVLARGYLAGSRRRKLAQAALRVATCLLLLAALARPHLEWEDARDRVLVLVDLSDSATAADLRAARALVADLGESARQDSARAAGVVVFGARPVLLRSPEDPGGRPTAAEAAATDDLAVLEALAELAEENRGAARTRAASPGAAPAAPESPARVRARELRAAAGTAESNLESALRLARGLLPASARRRVILASDGHESRGHAVAGARQAAAEGLVLDVLAPQPRSEPEVLVERVVAPSLVHVKEPFDLEVHVQSSAAGAGTLQIARNGFLLPYGGEVQLAAGRHVVKVHGLQLEEGFHTFTARVEVAAGADTDPGNNMARVAVAVSGRPRVLILDPDAEGLVNLVQALRGEEIVCEVRPPAGCPDTLDGLLAYDLVLLSDAPAAALPAGVMQLMKSYVRDHGGGLGMLGGDQSFGLGGYAKTPVEDVLPVDMTVKKSIDDPNLALVNVIDVSGSMTGDKIEIAKEAAIAAAEVVQEMDRVGVVAFDSLPYEILSLTPASERDTIIDRIASLAAGGGTDIEPALEMAYQMLREDRDARIKHVILLTDGQSPGRPDHLAQRMKFDGITVSTIAVGSGSDQRLLADIARRGGGRSYYTDDFATLPQIFTQETLTASKSLLVEEPTAPELREQDRMLEGIDVTGIPLLLGYVATTPKPDATVILVSDLGDPILAVRRAGSGWTVAFTSDAEYHWASEWLDDWDSFPKLWAQLVRRVMRAGRDGALAVQGNVTRDEAELVLELDVADYEGRFLSELDVAAAISRDNRPNDPPAHVPLELVAPGQYRATTAMPGYGVAQRIELTARSGDELVLSRPLSFVESYSPEHRVLAPNHELLAELAAAGGGTAQATAAQAWEFPGEPGKSRRDLSSHLLAAAACLFLLEIALRRL